MKSKLFSISATAILILLAIVAVGQVAPVLAGITPTPTPTATPTATPVPSTATPVPPPAEITPTPVETPTATPAPFLPDSGGVVNGLAQVESIFVVMAGALLLLLATIIHVMGRAK